MEQLMDVFPHVGGKRLLWPSRIRNKNFEKNFRDENFMHIREGLHMNF